MGARYFAAFRDMDGGSDVKQARVGRPGPFLAFSESLHGVRKLVVIARRIFRLGFPFTYSESEWGRYQHHQMIQFI